MPDTLLQTYLNKQFIKTTEEGNISSLKKAATEVAKKLRKNKALVIPYTLVAIDPLIVEDDPVVLEVERIIIAKWSAFKNSVTQTRDKATTYIRAVILEALASLTDDDELVAIIWHTSRDVVSYYKLGNETETIANLLQKFANKAEKAGQLLWSGNGDIQLPKISIPALKLESQIVKKDYLIERLHAAAGPQRIENGSQVNNEKANKHWPNSTIHWSTEFGAIAGEAIASSINTVVRLQNEAIANLEDQLNSALKELEPFFKEVGTAFIKSAKAANKRGELLWWKQALFSPSLDKSYRGLDPVKTAITMVEDLAMLVAPLYPHNVDFFLKETLKDVHGDQIDAQQLLSNLIDEADGAFIKEMKLLQPLINKIEGRKPLGTALANKLTGTSDADVFSEVGIDKNTQISLADFAVWLFHDLQAAKLAK